MNAPARAAPLILTALLPPEILAWADGLRRHHFPPARNFIRAHVTLFHALPPSAEGEVRRLIAGLASRAPPPATVSAIMSLGGGTALAVESAQMLTIHEELSAALHGLLTAQDRQKRRLHITIQNKVSAAEARALQHDLALSFKARRFAFTGIGLHRYLGGPWQDIGSCSFRGTKRTNTG